MPTDAQQPDDGHHVLILGGTRDARQLAEALAAEGLRVTYALHAPTGAVPPPAGCSLHLGSFGGEDGLADFIRAQGVTQWVNALHPHAASMQARTVKLAPAVGLPFHRLERPLWQPEPGDHWSEHDSVEALIAEVARIGPPAQTAPENNAGGARVQETAATGHRLLLTVGPQSLADFLPLTGPGIEGSAVQPSLRHRPGRGLRPRRHLDRRRARPQFRSRNCPDRSPPDHGTRDQEQRRSASCQARCGGEGRFARVSAQPTPARRPRLQPLVRYPRRCTGRGGFAID